MRAHQIMTHKVLTVTTDTTIVEAANIVLQNHISGLPVIDAAGNLAGVVSQSDFIRRAEIGTRLDPALAKVIAGIETVDHPIDPQLVAYAKTYLKATDRMQS